MNRAWWETEGVSCGGHRASACHVFPQSNGEAWCHGDCVWFSAGCVHKQKVVNCGDHRAPSCGQCPYGHYGYLPSTYCHGDCVWHKCHCHPKSSGLAEQPGKNCSHHELAKYQFHL